MFLRIFTSQTTQGVKLALAQSHLRPFLRLGDQNLDNQSPRWRVRHNPYMFVCQFFLSSPTQFWLKSWSVRCFNALEFAYRIFSAFTIETTMFTCWQGGIFWLFGERHALGEVMWFSKVLSCGGSCMAKVKYLSKWYSTKLWKYSKAKRSLSTKTWKENWLLLSLIGIRWWYELQKILHCYFVYNMTKRLNFGEMKMHEDSSESRLQRMIMSEDCTASFAWLLKPVFLPEFLIFC